MRDGRLSKRTVWLNTKRGIAALSLVLTLPMSCVEPKPCTLIGCEETLTVELEAEAWIPGEYVVTLAESGRTFECRIVREVAGAGGQAGSEGQDPVPGSAGRCDQVAGDPAQDWETPEIYSTQHLTIEINGTPRKLPISVRRAGSLLLETELMPSYTKSYPNGPDCGECLNATETLTLPAEGP